MSIRHYVLLETNWKTVQSSKYEVAILPWGATEAHNLHLPYGTDVIESDYFAIESARVAWERGARVIALPTVPYGVNTGQLDITFDINMNPSTQAAVLNDVVESLHRQGICKLVVMNGHGGNNFKQMIREIQPYYPNLFICTLDWYNILDWTKYFDESGDHGGELETSLMLNIAPHLVLPLSVAGDGAEKKIKLKGIREGWVWAQREWSRATATTGIGNPAKATKEKGRRFIEDTVTKIGEFLIELAAADINDLYE